MYKKITDESELKKIEYFIEPNLAQCVYLYINLHNYSHDSENIDVYVNMRNDNYSVIALRYYGTLHLYFTEEYDKDTLMSFIFEINPQVIFVCEKYGISLSRDLENKYDHEIMNNYLLPQNCGEYFEDVTEVTEDDIEKVVDFLLEDPVYIKSYRSKEDLYKQFKSRLHSKTGRYFKIVRDGKIVTLEGTNGETEKVVTTGSLLVSPQYRGQGLAKRIVFGMRYIICKMEQKTVYGLVSSETNSVAYLLELLGGKIANRVYKFHKK